MRSGAASHDREDRDCDQRDEDRDCGVSASAALRASPRFLDQRLQLVVLERIARIGRPGRCGDHGCLPPTIALVLLASVLSVKVNKNDPTDLFEQVAAEIRRAIADGEAKPGAAYPRPRTSPPSSA